MQCDASGQTRQTIRSKNKLLLVGLTKMEWRHISQYWCIFSWMANKNKIFGRTQQYWLKSEVELLVLPCLASEINSRNNFAKGITHGWHSSNTHSKTQWIRPHLQSSHSNNSRAFEEFLLFAWHICIILRHKHSHIISAHSHYQPAHSLASVPARLSMVLLSVISVGISCLLPGCEKSLSKYQIISTVQHLALFMQQLTTAIITPL